MFESHAERLIELPHDRKGCVGILYVIVGHLLAIELPGIGQRIGHPFAAAVELGLLVRILAVAERLNQIELQEQLLVEPRFFTHVRSDHRIVLGGMGICLGRELQPQSGSRIAVSPNLRKDRVIIRRVAHYGHVLVVLGRTAQHRRSADVDILDRLVHRHPFAGDRLTEGIEIHAHHVDELDAVLPQRFQVVRIVAASQQAAVHLGMERLDTSVADLREPRHIADVDHLHAAFSQQFHRTAGGDHLPAELSKSARELHHAGLIAHTD